MGVQRLTQRAPPGDTEYPGRRSGHGNSSFPSGHVAFATQVVTPFALEYFDESPGAAALLVLTLLPGGAAVGASTRI